jgi:hypothetical protein
LVLGGNPVQQLQAFLPVAVQQRVQRFLVPADRFVGRNWARIAVAVAEGAACSPQ